MLDPRLPLLPRSLNAVGRTLARIGIRPGNLGSQSLLEAARQQTGLADFGEDSFREGLDRLVESLESEARLSVIGRFIARQDLVGHLSNRLQLVDWHRRYPEIGDLPIRRPIFIVGQGRTGTTILHELLALDPNNRVPLTWETDFPFPPPERAQYTSDPRIARSQSRIDRSESLIPDFKRMHRMGARVPQECVRITASDCKSAIFTATWRVPAYTRWLLDEADLSSTYALHRKTLQLLAWRCPGERWVLKSPGHLWCLDAVLDEYPDACFIQTHRDPLRILSSLASLEMVLRKMSSDSNIPVEIAREWSGWLARSYDRSVDFRESGRIPDSRVADLQFREFIADPIPVVRKIYDRFDLDLLPETEARMLSYLRENPSDRDGAHKHRLEETGLDIDEERARVKRYQEYFDVPTEPSGG
jgi:hypothetical protein